MVLFENHLSISLHLSLFKFLCDSHKLLKTQFTNNKYEKENDVVIPNINTNSSKRRSM